MIITHKYIFVVKALKKGWPQSGITLSPNALKTLICYVKDTRFQGEFFLKWVESYNEIYRSEQ